MSLPIILVALSVLSTILVLIPTMLDKSEY
jgi:hypothetical protein